MRRIFAPVFLLLILPGCYAATKATVDMANAQKDLETARSLDAPQRAVYAWTMADEYMKKAKDEWARSDYQAAYKLLKQARHWADQAASIAKANEVDGSQESFQDEPLQDLEDATEPNPSQASEPTTTQEGVWQ